MPAKIADRLAVAFTERSMPPIRMASIMPSVKMPISETWKAMELMLSAVGNMVGLASDMARNTTNDDAKEQRNVGVYSLPRTWLASVMGLRFTGRRRHLQFHAPSSLFALLFHNRLAVRRRARALRAAGMLTPISSTMPTTNFCHRTECRPAPGSCG